MIVVKLGGSLLSDAVALYDCLNTIEKIKDKVVIVPGGGCFADHVRTSQLQWKFDDVIAHEMAILAMKQMALLFKSIKPSFVLAESKSSIFRAMTDHSAVIWSPVVTMLDPSIIEASWNVTSDSLAAWLAGQLNAEELIVVKSVEIQHLLTIQQMQDQGVVDRSFAEFTQDAVYSIKLLNKHRFNEYFSV